MPIMCDPVRARIKNVNKKYTLETIYKIIENSGIGTIDNIEVHKRNIMLKNYDLSTEFNSTTLYDYIVTFKKWNPCDQGAYIRQMLQNYKEVFFEVDTLKTDEWLFTNFLEKPVKKDLVIKQKCPYKKSVNKEL